MTRIQAMVFTLLLCGALNAAEPIDIGSRLELMRQRLSSVSSRDHKMPKTTPGGAKVGAPRPTSSRLLEKTIAQRTLKKRVNWGNQVRPNDMMVHFVKWMHRKTRCHDDDIDQFVSCPEPTIRLLSATRGSKISIASLPTPAPAFNPLDRFLEPSVSG